MAERRFEIAEFSLGVATGLIIGAVVGLILAPESGSKTRKKITGWALDTCQSATELVDYARKAIDMASEKAEEFLGLQEKGVKKKLEEIRSELERYNLSGS